MSSPLSAHQRIIVALDVDQSAQAQTIVATFGDSIEYYKVGYQLFFREGMGIVHSLLNQGKRVFLDLKLGDIDNTMRAGLKAIPGEVAMLTIQGNKAVATATVEALRPRQPRPQVLLLTALSSSQEEDVQTRNETIVAQTRLALATGCDGVVASGAGVALVRQTAGSKKLNIVAPGIRPLGSNAHEHRHILQPGQAITNGADQLVIGRALTNAHNPEEALAGIVDEIKAAVAALD